ncbi:MULTISPECIES: FeoA family protein [unclassified Moraxella]|uniref:FeoA family protein n=1 Tax=unclassified Moraxella TaxID=2685852 RepID=UPI003AF76D82
MTSIPLDADFGDSSLRFSPINIHSSATPPSMTPQECTNVRDLLSLPRHQIVYIDAITTNPAFGADDAMVSKRLFDLGFLPNTAIKVVAKGLFGRPPFAVQLAGGSQFSLRKEELAKIQCRLV